MMRSSERDVFLDEERKYSLWKGGGQLFLNLQVKHEFFYYESSVKRLKAPIVTMPVVPVCIAESMRFDPLVELPKRRRRGLIDPPRPASDRLVSP